MIQIEANLSAKYNLALQKQGIPKNEQRYYIKWLRYYLDFCNKYGFNKSDSESLPKFIEKLQSKKKNKNQQQQATSAIRFFYMLSKNDNTPEHDETIVPFSHEVPHVKEERLPYSAKGEERRPVADAKRNQKKVEGVRLLLLTLSNKKE